ncbi:SDR family oxidoreductase [Goodfellowiella coeruleoviolacea]|uniref:Short-chain dehydrogenase n=1 Tax=Goodfellowiella coeruleoviolacea TaxID=334858 RepID=A0AAE3GGL2_9PSEU|nr:SDR family oxidoreductase [Goodfellowiella coeruleoviolacea]MCP2167007.1 Short-chain dehydrogenase [Goodfellowiella coeruleoviolacea]
MRIAGSTALVTGANRGLGRHFAQALLDRGAAKVYATARRPEAVDLTGVTTLALDVTDPDSITSAAARAQDVDLLVNNAGMAAFTDLVTGDLADIRAEVETNFFGPLQVIRAFAPVLASRGGGAVLNVLSALSWAAYPGSGGYAAAKAAAWSMTNTVRLELAAQRTLVTGLVMASTDTDMTAGLDVPKNDPADVVRAALDGIEAGEIEVVADADSARIKAALAEHPSALYPSAYTGQADRAGR